MKEETLTDRQRMVSAMVGASLTALAVTPLDVVKTRLQSQLVGVENCAKQVKVWCGMIDCVCSTRPLSPSSKILFTGTWDGIFKIVKYEGLTKLWRGLSATLVMSLPTTVIYFIGYEHLRDAFRSLSTSLDSKKLDSYSPLLSGSISRTIAVTAISPAELFRTRLQSESGSSGSTSKVLKDIQGLVKKNGISYLWKGLSPTLWRDVPFSGIYWFGYESFKPFYSSFFPEQSTFSNFAISFSSGASSGAIAAIVTTPFDVAKTWRQVGIGYIQNSKTTLQVLSTIFAQEGLAGLNRGITARVLKTAPACAIMISTYELGKTYFAGK